MCTITKFKRHKLVDSVYVVRVYKDGMILSPWFKCYWIFNKKKKADEFNSIKHVWNLLITRLDPKFSIHVGGGFFHSFLSLKDARSHLEMIRNEGMWNEENDEELCIYRAIPGGLQYEGITTGYKTEYTDFGFDTFSYRLQCLISRELKLVELIQ